MNKDEIKKALLYCQDYDCDSCIDCPYYARSEECTDDILKDALNLINEQEKEIERLKAEFKQLEANAEILARGVRDLNHENYELTEQVKQAQIDVLNKVKDIVFDYLGVKNIKEAEALSLLDSTLTYDVVTCGIDELIKEVQDE